MTESPFRHREIDPQFKIIEYGRVGRIYYAVHDEICHIELIVSHRRGLGKLLVAELVKTIGSNKIIEMDPIIEDATLSELKSDGSVEYVQKLNKSLTIDDTEDLRKLKIVRLLNGGGINVDRLTIYPKGNGETSASLSGRT